MRFSRREATANITSWRVVVALGVIGLGVAAFVAVHQTTERAGDAHDSARAMDASGRHVLEVDATAGRRLTSATCEGFATVSTAQSAFATARGGRARLANGHIAPVVYATPALPTYLGLRRPADGNLLVGETLAERAGLRDGAWISVVEVEESWSVGDLSDAVRQVVVLPVTPRTEALDDALVVITPPSETPSDTCLVEAREGHSRSLAAAIGNLAPDGATLSLAPLRPEIADRTDPEDTLRTLPGDTTTLIAGALGAVLVLGWWFLRRQEWALYASFGLPLRRIVIILALEWAAVVALPIIVGASWGLAFAGPDHHVRAYRIGIVNGVVMLLISVVAVPAWTAWVRRASIARVLKGD